MKYNKFYSFVDNACISEEVNELYFKL